MRTPLNKFTFKSRKIKEWVEERCYGLTLNLFAGKTVLNIENEIRNDMREGFQCHYTMDALSFCRYYREANCEDASFLFDTVVLDPPYSYRKSMEMYEGAVTSPFNTLKDALIPIITENSRIITFGYHSVSMGKKRGFEIEEICVMSHGGAIHDTIATVEIRQ
tara:strand:- start:18482 stop:18970 length:489 start_codon:yes stop_codon:yes gene_type:complete